MRRVDLSSSWLGGTRRPRSRRGDRSSAVLLWRGLLRRVASWALLFSRADGCAFYSWPSRPLEARPCAYAAPPPRSGVVFSNACLLGFFYLPAAPMASTHMQSVRVLELAKNNKSGLVRAHSSLFAVKASITTRNLSLHRLTNAKNTDRPALRHRSSRNRCTHAAQELPTRRGTSAVTQQWMRQENRCPSSPSAD